MNRPGTKRPYTVMYTPPPALGSHNYNIYYENGVLMVLVYMLLVSSYTFSHNFL